MVCPVQHRHGTRKGAEIASVPDRRQRAILVDKIIRTSGFSCVQIGTTHPSYCTVDLPFLTNPELVCVGFRHPIHIQRQASKQASKPLAHRSVQSLRLRLCLRLRLRLRQLNRFQATASAGPHHSARLMFLTHIPRPCPRHSDYGPPPRGWQDVCAPSSLLFNHCISL